VAALAVSASWIRVSAARAHRHPRPGTHGPGRPQAHRLAPDRQPARGDRGRCHREAGLVRDPHPQHRIYPYLLRKLTIERPNHVWCADVTYIPMRRGFLYLVAIMDWATRKVLAWRLSNTMDAGFRVAALEEALARYGQPEIFNTDQASSPASPSPACCATLRSASAWMAEVGGLTMSSSNASGAP